MQIQYNMIQKGHEKTQLCMYHKSGLKKKNSNPNQNKNRVFLSSKASYLSTLATQKPYARAT